MTKAKGALVNKIAAQFVVFQLCECVSTCFGPGAVVKGLDAGEPESHQGGK